MGMCRLWLSQEMSGKINKVVFLTEHFQTSFQPGRKGILLLSAAALIVHVAVVEMSRVIVVPLRAPQEEAVPLEGFLFNKDKMERVMMETKLIRAGISEGMAEQRQSS